MLGSENETMFCDTQNVFQLPLSSLLFPAAVHLVFWKSKLISLEKKNENHCLKFMFSIKHENGKFHVVAVRQGEGNVQ